MAGNSIISVFNLIFGLKREQLDVLIPDFMPMILKTKISLSGEVFDGLLEFVF